jgi:hypothetical protein
MYGSYKGGYPATRNMLTVDSCDKNRDARLRAKP